MGVEYGVGGGGEGEGGHLGGELVHVNEVNEILEVRERERERERARERVCVCVCVRVCVRACARARVGVL